MPSTASELSIAHGQRLAARVAPSPRRTNPRRSGLRCGIPRCPCAIVSDNRPYTSSIDMAAVRPPIALWPIGARMAVILAAQGVIKKHPILVLGHAILSGRTAACASMRGDLHRAFNIDYVIDKLGEAHLYKPHHRRARSTRSAGAGQSAHRHLFA